MQIIADPEQLKRVIHNIINNSIKYLDKQQGFINIRIKDVGDFIQVEIEDNGRGISAKRDLPYIFDRFLPGGCVAQLGNRRQRHWPVDRKEDHRRPWWKDLGDQQRVHRNGHVFCNS